MLYFGRDSIVKAHPEFKKPLDSIPKEFNVAYDSAQGNLIISLNLMAKNIVNDRLFIESSVDYAKLIPVEMIKRMQQIVEALAESVGVKL
jgi:hypothetical protein